MSPADLHAAATKCPAACSIDPSDISTEKILTLFKSPVATSSPLMEKGEGPLR
jgi:hypothetical protein